MHFTFSVEVAQTRPEYISFKPREAYFDSWGRVG